MVGGICLLKVIKKDGTLEEYNEQKIINAVNKSAGINEKFITNEGYEISIIDYINKQHVLINFEDRPDLQIWSTLQNIKNGQIKNPYHLSVYGKGYYGVGKYTARINNIKTQEYIKWFSMFVRCYDEQYLLRQPAYTMPCQEIF